MYRQKRLNCVPVVLQLIFNPVAGKGRSAHAIGAVRSFLQEHGLDYQLLTTEREGHATELAASVPPGSTVIAMGGDGTVHEVVKGLMNGGPTNPSNGRRLGVIPVGSGDDFAYALGIPRNDLPGALKRIATPDVTRVDVGFVDGEPFTNSTGVGFDAEAAYRVRTSPKVFKGLAAYLYGMLSALGTLRSVGVRVVVDGEERFAGPALLVSLQNGPRTGGSFMFAPGARNDDGVLDVLVAGEFGRMGALGILPRLMKGRHLTDPKIHLFRGSSVELHWDEPQRAHADGEPLGPRKRYSATLKASALEVIK